MFAALQISWRMPVNFWRVCECVWMLRRTGERLERRFGCRVNFGQNWAEVFVVEVFGCKGRDG